MSVRSYTGRSLVHQWTYLVDKSLHCFRRLPLVQALVVTSSPSDDLCFRQDYFQSTLGIRALLQKERLRVPTLHNSSAPRSTMRTCIADNYLCYHRRHY